VKIEEMDVSELEDFRFTIATSMLENKDKYPLYDKIEARMALLQRIVAQDGEFKNDEVFDNE
jgi:hypothetical protein